MMTENFQRSLNLFDFGLSKGKDAFLIDDYSDSSEFGGESES